MAKKLTDVTINELLTPPNGDDLIMLVDVGDTTSDPEGTTKRQKVTNYLRGRVFGRNTNVTNTPANTLIFNMSNSANHPGIQALQGDFVLFMDETEDSLIIGIAKDTCVGFPTDLNDTAKFLKFYEGSSLIP